MDAVSIRVPYRHLNDAELELVGLGDPNGEINESGGGLSRRPVSSSAPSSSSPHSDDSPRPVQRSSLKTLIFSCMVGAGVQFGWALQLSLLTPYIQVQPCVGIWSDRCHSKYGRRRPFILAGCLMICLAVTLIGFSADIGYFLGDTKDQCSTYKGPRYRAAGVFIFGFWMLDLANNTVQGPARALLADLAGPDQRNSANAIFCSWMAFGNILGFSSGASGNWHSWFPFLTTKACCEVCGNLKAAFLVAVAFLMFCMLVTLYFAKEIPLEARPEQRLSDFSPLLNNSQQHGHVLSQANLGQHDSGQGSEILGRANSDGHLDFNSDVNRDQVEAFSNGPGAVLVNILTSLRHLPPGMHSVLLVMALTWVSWFPFFLFDTDWMGREVYHGNPNGALSESTAYQNGVREGAFGLLLNSVVLGLSSFLIDPMCRRMGARIVWAISNFTVFICMAATTIISLLSISEYSNGIQHVIGENTAIKIAALVIFSVLGFPLSITYSVPFSVTAELTAGTGGGQGLSTGVLNLAIVIPQMIVSLGAGPWDALFGGGNIPAFALASVFALAAGILALLRLPGLSNSYSSAGFHGFG
ncbi:sucrose transport protein SUT4-like isoform X2 [Phoenix dactylifera]|uniref:Sucrose transport protein SUT4-like isoform X2 n=1 Tax=Phoenix dactylifera TaxID=42345 RepID=A0A8B7CMK6_PHODC|nr:sucrose transport protein SUT4-like isoform X2 [Phoenix dactylifera]